MLNRASRTLVNDKVASIHHGIATFISPRAQYVPPQYSEGGLRFAINAARHAADLIIGLISLPRRRLRRDAHLPIPGHSRKYGCQYEVRRDDLHFIIQARFRALRAGRSRSCTGPSAQNAPMI